MNDEPLLLSFAAEEFEYRRGTGEGVVTWDVEAWAGTTRDRLVVRSEGEAESDETEKFETTLVWSRAVTAFWNVNLGWRGDWQPERRRNWFAAELEGLAPGFIETRFSLLAGSRGRWGSRLELETEWTLSRTLELVPSARSRLAQRGGSGERVSVTASLNGRRGCGCITWCVRTSDPTWVIA